MKSKRQPKVHKYSKHRRKNANPAQTALSVALTFLIAGAIGVVGYSVAKPLLQYDGKVQPDLSVAETAQPSTTAVPVATQTETVLLPVNPACVFPQRHCKVRMRCSRRLRKREAIRRMESFW